MAEQKASWTLMKVLDWTRGHFEAKGIDNPRLDAELILAHVLKMQRVMLYARFDQPLQSSELEQIRTMVARRARHEPMAYLLGSKEFWSVELGIGPGVLIPRPDTETLIEVCLKRMDKEQITAVADVGTGSGAIALALGKECPNASVYGLEVSSEAREIATRNTKKNALSDRVQIVESNLLSGLKPENLPLDILAANLPYIPSEDMAGLMEDVRNFEPHLALDGGPDGLDLIRALIQEAPKVLRPGGLIALEAGHEQIETIGELLGQAGFGQIELSRDLADLLRVASAKWPEN